MAKTLLRCVLFFLTLNLAPFAKGQIPFATVQFASLPRLQSVASKLNVTGPEGDFEGTLLESLLLFEDVIDPANPCGAFVVQTDASVDLVFFVPVKGNDAIDTMLNRLAISRESVGEGVVSFNYGGEFYLMQSGSWCYVASTHEGLRTLPDSVSTWIESAPTHDLQVDVMLESIPRKIRSYALERIAGWFASGSINTDSERGILDLSVAGIAVQETLRAADASDHVQLGISLDADENATCELRFDGDRVDHLFRRGTEFVQFHLANAVASGTYRTQLSEEQVVGLQQWAHQIREVFNADINQVEISSTSNKALVHQVVSDLTQTIESVVSRGDLDLGAVSLGETSAVGFQVNDAPRLLDKLVALGREIEKTGGPIRQLIDQDSDDIGRSLTFSVPSELVGGKANSWAKVALVAKHNALYLAFGSEPKTLLRKLYTDEGREVGPVHGTFTVDASSQEAVTVSSIKSENGLLLKVLIPGSTVRECVAANKRQRDGQEIATQYAQR